MRLRIAHTLGLSETAFVRGLSDPAISVRFFTPSEEVPLCGHATVAAVGHMVAEGRLPASSKAQVQVATGAGVLPVAIVNDATGAIISLTQSAPDFSRPPIPLADVAECLGLSAEQCAQVVCTEPVPAPCSTGLYDVCVLVRSVDMLRRLAPNWDDMSRISEQHDLCGFHVAVLLEDSDRKAFGDADIYARNFAPAVGINEESATGTANGAMASWLWRNGVIPTSKTTLVVAQGDHMEPPAPSRITVKVMDAVPGQAAPSVGGATTFIRSGRLKF